jgi:chemotaxis protein histidine kinase CheA
MTASPPLNGHKRPTMPVLGDWRPATPEPVEEQSTPQPEPAVDAEVARAKAWAEAEERRVAAEAEKEERLLKAQAEADAIRVKAEEDARRLRLNNDKLERKAREEEEATQARIAESRKRKADANRAREEADRHAAEQQAAAEAEAAEVEEAENRWRGYARSFYIVCAIVALPVQVAAFYNPRALWLMAAPLMLEGGAWVVLKGAAAAVAGHRPHWHYRLIAWLLAFIAAGINLWHGLNAFDPATAIGTAFASVAGPGVWDLHEHGRIRKRDGVLTRRERKAAEKAAKARAKQEAADEARRAAEKEAADEAARVAREELIEERKREFPKVWAEAVKIGAALGKAPDDPAVWPRAYRNIEGTDPGESIESITARRAAERRVESALTGTPVSTLSLGRSPQVDQQMPRRSRRGHVGGPTVRGVRRAGDTTSYSTGARKQAAIAAKKSTRSTAVEKDGR